MLDGTTVLVVEDEDPLRQLYASWLQQKDAKVVEAANGEDALKKWDDDVDVVVLDRRMPKMYGDEVLKEARLDGLHTPVMMVTAVDPDLDMIEIEFDEYMTKPVDPDEFLSKVSDMVKMSEVRDLVRDFVRVGVTVHKLQQEHSDDLLKTHSDFQRLKRQYRDLRDDVKQNVDDLTTYEKHLLLAAQNQVP